MHDNLIVVRIGHDWFTNNELLVGFYLDDPKRNTFYVCMGQTGNPVWLSPVNYTKLTLSDEMQTEAIDFNQDEGAQKFARWVEARAELLSDLARNPLLTVRDKNHLQPYFYLAPRLFYWANQNVNVEYEQLNTESTEEHVYLLNEVFNIHELRYIAKKARRRVRNKLKQSA